MTIHSTVFLWCQNFMIVYPKAPSGVEKEKIKPEDIFELDKAGAVLKKPANEELKLTECSSLFFAAIQLRHAGAVLHSHSINVVLATILAKKMVNNLELEFSELEMIKGIRGFGYHDTFILPVIENTPRESELAATLIQAIERYPRTCAVAVQNHGIFVWGENEKEAKTQAECLDYLCEVMLKKRMYSINWESSLRLTFDIF